MRYAAKLVLRAGHPHEAGSVTDVLAAAFAGGDVDRWLGATTESRIAYFRTVVDAALAEGIVRVAEADGVLIGAALWFPHPAVSPPTPSGMPAAPAPGSEPTLVPGGGSVAPITAAAQPHRVTEDSRTAARSGAARQDRAVGDDAPTSFALRETLVAPQPGLDRLAVLERLLAERRPIRTAHHHLAYLGVRPEQQGQGIGSYLLIGHHAYLHVLRVPAYLEANDQRNRALYRRHGYTDVGTPILLPGGIPIWPMWRPPKPAGPVPGGRTPRVAFLSYR